MVASDPETRVLSPAHFQNCAYCLVSSHKRAASPLMGLQGTGGLSSEPKHRSRLERDKAAAAAAPAGRTAAAKVSCSQY